MPGPSLSEASAQSPCQKENLIFLIVTIKKMSLHSDTRDGSTTHQLAALASSTPVVAPSTSIAEMSSPLVPGSLRSAASLTKLVLVNLSRKILLKGPRNAHGNLGFSRGSYLRGDTSLY